MHKNKHRSSYSQKHTYICTPLSDETRKNNYDIYFPLTRHFNDDKLNLKKSRTPSRRYHYLAHKKNYVEGVSCIKSICGVIFVVDVLHQ